MLSTLKHQANKFLLLIYGPAQLDEKHDPVRAEERAIDRDNPSDAATRGSGNPDDATRADIRSGAASRRARRGTGGSSQPKPFGS